MQPLPKSELIHLLNCMQEMHACAIASDWQELAQLDEKRRAILELEPAAGSNTDTDIGNKYNHSRQQPHSPVTAHCNTEFRGNRDSLIAEIRNLDYQILEIVESGRQRLLKETRSFSAQMKAKELYARTNSFT